MPSGDIDYTLRIEELKAYHTSKSGLVRAVNDVSFDIQKGETVGLFGESGAGKTSVALAILGLFERLSRFYASTAANEENIRLWNLRDKARKKGVTSVEMGEELPGVEGRIWFKGKDLLSLDEDEFRKIRGQEITYIPQGTTKALNPYSNIEVQTGEPLWAHDEDGELIEIEVARRILETLDLVEIGDIDIRKYMKPREFSVGEDQRVLIAMALITNPALLIADEPTTAVDLGVRRRILDAIDVAKEKLDLSMLLISNDQGLIADTSDRIAVMSAGRIMEFGDASRVLKTPGHPFTRAFIMSNPSMAMLKKIREKGLRIRGIPGRPPDMTRLPSGCPFHPRCEFCQEICKQELPEYREVEQGYWVFCHRHEELPEF